jgi:O-methyltransferase involved in polyketide biosynthesis
MGATETISPTAHYTGYVWARNGLSHPELQTLEGRVLFESLRPLMIAASAAGHPTLEAYLLARHRAIDERLERAISEHRVSQVIEVAAGMSARGWRFTRRHPESLTYIEGDLPAMASRKRAALRRMGSLSERHRVVELDALRSAGQASLAAVAAELDRSAGLAIVTEGLLGYLAGADVEAIWRRFASTLGDFAAGRYISDIHLGMLQTLPVRAFLVLLSAFVRGRVRIHFQAPGEVVAALRAAGFAGARVDEAGPLQLARVLEAWT